MQLLFSKGNTDTYTEWNVSITDLRKILVSFMGTFNQNFTSHIYYIIGAYNNRLKTHTKSQEFYYKNMPLSAHP